MTQFAAVQLITVGEAAAHLRLDLITDGASPETVTDERLPDLEAKIDNACAIVIDYLKYQPTGWDETSAPPPVKAATLIVLTNLWEDRSGAAADYLSAGGPVARLLARFRDPAIA